MEYLIYLEHQVYIGEQEEVTLKREDRSPELYARQLESPARGKYIQPNNPGISVVLANGPVYLSVH